ncbi:helix-turn-helix domain-containing protein [Jeotgalibaca porci]|uniref:helix-turn-helix domain-containing protein n=1 Tax=Jeotgalibaca porci TaxID=1868793 RepID=UPI0035A04A14
MEIKKSYYAIIPAHVRYDETLTPNAKLLYGEVTALCNERGYCWASNSYFADLYSVSNVSISKWINQLVKQGYLASEMQYKEGSKEILHRYLRLVNDPIKEKFNTPQRKVNDPIKEKFKDNTTPNNTINNTTNTLSSNKLPESELKSEFDKIWALYPNKKGKAKAYTAYKKSIKDGVANTDIEKGIKAYSREIEHKRTSPEYIAHGSTWFSNKRWEDDYETGSDSNDMSWLETDNLFGGYGG